MFLIMDQKEQLKSDIKKALRCRNCIWACRRDFDTSMILCKKLNSEVYAESLPCKDYELYDGNFYGI